MVSHSSIHTILYAVGIVLAILTWTLSAGIVADYNDACMCPFLALPPRHPADTLQSRTSPAPSTRPTRPLRGV